MTSIEQEARHTKVYVSLCCHGSITYEGEPEWPGSEVATMNCKCLRCEQWCTPVDVDNVFARIAELEGVIEAGRSAESADPVVDSIILQGEQGEPAGTITVTVGFKDGRSVELIRTGANSIYHMVW